jgi:hypothetical protein
MLQPSNRKGYNPVSTIQLNTGKTMINTRYKIIQAHTQIIQFNQSTSTVSTHATRYDDLMIYATHDCFVSFTSTATKSSSNLFVPGNTQLELVCNRTDFINVIGESAAGKLYVYPITT